MISKSLLIGLIAISSKVRAEEEVERHYDPHAICKRICHETEECREDPHNHGSYCKLDNYPHVCFGLYKKREHHEDGKHRDLFCFEPNSKHCNDAKLKPVKCGRRREDEDD